MLQCNWTADVSAILATVLFCCLHSLFQLCSAPLLQTSTAHQQPRILKEKLKKKSEDKAWEEVKRGNRIFGHGLRRRKSQPGEGEKQMGRNRDLERKDKEKGLSEGQGHGVGRRSGQLGTHSPFFQPLEDCG